MDAVAYFMELKNDIAELESLTGGVEEFCRKQGLASKHGFELTLVLDEVFTNIVSYGFEDEKDHRIRIEMFKKDDLVTIRVEDDGAPFDPTTAERAELGCSLEDCRIGGVGLHLIDRIMTRVMYKRRNNKNILILEKRLTDT